MVPLVRTIFGIVLGGAVARLFALIGRFHAARGGARAAVTRRGFVRNAALGATGIILAESAIGFYEFFKPNKTGAFGSAINVSANQVPDVDATPVKNPQGKFWLIHNQDGVMALYWKCVHLGCTVPWNASEGDFHCPCHGSVYNYNGERTAGPAPRPLDYMGITVDDSGNLSVDTGDIKSRGHYEKSQATPYNF
jgi:cytochrome b6-f complex iron-sulfur subunit